MLTFISKRNHGFEELLSRNVEIRQTDSLDSLKEWLEAIETPPFDIEANHILFYKAVHLLLYSLGDEHNQFVVDAPSMGIKWMNAYSKKTFIAHNAKYDMGVSALHGFYWDKCHDTMLTEQRLGLGAGRSNALDAVLARRLGVQISKDTRSDFIRMNSNDLFKIRHIVYSAGDIKWMLPLKKIQDNYIAKYKVDRLINIENGIVPVLLEAELEGIICYEEPWRALLHEAEQKQLDEEKMMDSELRKLLLQEGKLQYLAGKYTRERKRVKVEQTDLFSPVLPNENLNRGNINYASSPQVLELFDLFGWEKPFMWKVKADDYGTKRKMKAPSIREQAVTRWMIENPNHDFVPFLSHLLFYKEYHKSVNSFGIKFLMPNTMRMKDHKPGFVEPRTGKVHTIYRQCTAKNGRLQSGDTKLGLPNMQNVKKEKRYRVCFGLTLQEIADGYKITTCDLSGAELVILGALANDTRLLELKQEGDLHGYLATEAYSSIINSILIWHDGDQKKIDHALRELLKPNKIYNLIEATPGELVKIHMERVEYAKSLGSIVISSETAKDIRDPFKNVVYGWCYGAEANKIAETLKIPLEYAKLVDDVFAKELPISSAFLDKAAEDAVRDGYIVFNDRTNSRHWFKIALDHQSWNKPLPSEFKGDIERAAKNYKISGTQADMIKECMVEIRIMAALEDVKSILLLQVHDELVYKHTGGEEFSIKIANKMGEVANRYLNGVATMEATYEILDTWTK